MARSPNVREVAPVPSSDGQFVDMPPGADPVRRREPDPIVARLQERMERLPHGHPSSPYNDDGSRKPPVPDLSQYELPIPGDPDYRPEPSRTSEADRPGTQTPEHVRPGANADERSERTADRTELWEVPPDVEPPTDAEDAGHVPEVREQLDQAPALDLAPDEEDTPDARREASQEEGGTSHDAPADDLDERGADELPVSGNLDHQPEPSRASGAEGPTDEGSASASDRQHTDDKAAADEQPAPDSKAARPSDSGGESRSDSGHESPPADREKLGDLESQEQAEQPLSQITDRAMERCQNAEGRDAEGNYGEYGLTPAMRRIESQLEYGHLADQTEKYALKDPARFKEKLAERIKRFPNADPNDLAAEIHDGVRYTLILDFDHYTDGVGLAHSKLAEAGYDQIETKPGWHGEEYKGINSQWEDLASGIRFEVQFHTSESWKAKQITHEAYEAIRSNKASVEDVETLRAYQREVSATVRIPLGALDVAAYKRGR
jgi:hypothetical protein